MATRRWGLVSGCALLAASVAILTTCTGPDRGGEGRTGPSGDTLGRLPMPTDYFVENVGQVGNGEVLYYHRAGGMDIGFAESAIFIKLLKPMPGSSPHAEDSADLASADPLRTFREAEVGGATPLGAPLSLSALSGVMAMSPQAARRGLLVRITFDGANRVAPQVREELRFPSHYFLGSDPGDWRTGVRSYRELVYKDLYDGVDLVCRPDGKGLKYELHMSAQADPSPIALRYDGIESLEPDRNGEMVLHTDLGDLRDSAPLAVGSSGGEVPCRFDLRGPRSYGFAMSGPAATGRIVIDPLIYSTFLGGSSDDFGQDIALDGAGHAYVAGTTLSVDFPTTPGTWDSSLDGFGDVFVAKLDPSGTSLVYATFLGGGMHDQAGGIAVDGSGRAYVSGGTRSPDFPATVGAFDSTYNGGWWWGGDAFVAKLDAAGASIIYATYLGGSRADAGGGIRVDASGCAYVTGGTASTDFPTTPGAFDTSHNGGYLTGADAFVAKLDPTGTGLLYSTFIGGSLDEGAGSIALDGLGSAHVVGGTASGDLPVTSGAFDTSYHGTFVAKLESDGSSLLYCTYLGGNRLDRGRAIAVDPAGNAYITGWTTSDAGFPITQGAFDVSHNGGYDAFVVKLDPAGATLLYGTYLGGSGFDYVGDFGRDITVDSSGAAYVTGTTSSADFPTTPRAFDTSHNGSRDVFLAKLDPSGASLLYSTYLGGSSYEDGSGIAADASGQVYVTGGTQSVDFPTTPGAFDLSYDGAGPLVWGDAFVVKFSIPPPPCPHSQGFWKNHPADWPVLTLDLGSETYDQAELIALLKTPPRGDATIILAKQLIAAKLNIANGSDPAPVSTEITDADGLYASQTGRLPYDVHASTITGQRMVGLAAVLDGYNNELLTPGCSP